VLTAQIIATGDQAAVWFENRTPMGVVPFCDWVRTRDGLITEIQSFYDSARVREVLSRDAQKALGQSR
jgi:ketosteroid isomerase-like protein